jgi:hypothetical protein
MGEDCWRFLDFDESSVVKLMHQTVKDFIGTPGFMHRALGAEVSNGNSFLAKYFITQAMATGQHQNLLPVPGPTPSRPTEIALLGMFHAQLSESTTGISQGKFFDSLTDHAVQRAYQNIPRTKINSRMSLAVIADLRLYICETLTKSERHQR